ncbi:hypothetical protein D910_04322 [Dendroctonus ponderosae]
MADKRGTESKNLSLEENQLPDSTVFSPEDALEWGEGFLKEMQACSHPLIKRSHVNALEEMVKKLRQMTQPK